MTVMSDETMTASTRDASPTGDQRSVVVSPKVSEREKRVLLAYADYYDGGGCGVYFRTIVKETELELSQVRRATRSLARKGLTELNRGLFNDEGMIAGSGYGLTRQGWHYALDLRAANLAQGSPVATSPSNAEGVVS